MIDDAPVVVVGTGPAGAAAAVFLARAGARVLLLEAGSARSALGLTARVRGVTIAKYRHPLKAREDVVRTGDANAVVFEDLSAGGLTNHWSCAVPRFSSEDFADAARAGEANVWPIGYRDLVPWYERVEPQLHISGTVTDVPHLPAGRVSRIRQLGKDWNSVREAAKKSGRSVAALPYAYGSETTLTLSGTVFNAFVRLVKPELRGGRISVRYDTRVLRLEYADDRQRVKALVVRHAGSGTETRIACRAVVLAAGAINTAQILLESSSADFPDGLGNTHGVLGHYLHDHPMGKVVIDLPKRVSVHPPAYVTRPNLDQAAPLLAAGCMQWSGTGGLVQSVLRGHPGRLDWIGFTVFGTMPPKTENFLTVDRTRPLPNGSNALVLNAHYSRESMQVLEDTRDQLVGILREAGWDPRVRVWTLEDVGAAKHFGGTCRMHADPRFGMLDSWSRLHAVRNVMVADSAAFTTSPEKNPVLTAMALAARGGDRLAQELKSGDL